MLWRNIDQPLFLSHPIRVTLPHITGSRNAGRVSSVARARAHTHTRALTHVRIHTKEKERGGGGKSCSPPPPSLPPVSFRLSRSKMDASPRQVSVSFSKRSSRAPMSAEWGRARRFPTEPASPQRRGETWLAPGSDPAFIPVFLDAWWTF